MVTCEGIILFRCVPLWGALFILGDRNMKCDNSFCIYQKEDECILNEIELDINGICMDCIYVNIPKKILSGYKKKLLENLDSR